METDGHRLVECNTVQAVRNSANKLLMKTAFQGSNVVTAAWIHAGTLPDSEILTWAKHPCGKFRACVSKSLNGSRGRGNRLHTTEESLRSFLTTHPNRSNYILEVFHDYVREYRLHVTKDGCFYACRKMLKSDTPEKDRWFRNDSNSSWIVEDNPKFDKPTNWTDIVAECVKALNAVGLDVGACDVKVQSAKDSKGNVRKSPPEFIVIEINSAPSFGELTTARYLEQIPRILSAKAATR